jgi:hypothetical protein
MLRLGLQLIYLQCTFTAICSAILTGLRFLLTNASVENKSIRFTNDCAMLEMYSSGRLEQSYKTEGMEDGIELYGA